MAEAKPQFVSEFQEYDTPDFGHQKRVRNARVVESLRLGLTSLALLSALVIVGTSADTLAVYNTTHLGEDFLLPLWPSAFDIRPTIALVTCGAIITLTSIISLLVSKVPAIRHIPLMHSGVSFLAPTVCLIAGLIGTSFFYGVNSSNTNYALKSWSCQWSTLSMTVKPHWGTLCKESKVALYLTVMMIPLEILVLGTSALSVFAQKKSSSNHERKGSPALS